MTMAHNDITEHLTTHALDSPILWQNETRTVTLLDIPRSIAAAQSPDFQQKFLLSTPPLQSPFPSNEPKKASAKEKLQKNTGNAGLHDEYQNLLKDALYEIGKANPGNFCHLRPFVENSPRAVKKRKLDNVDSPHDHKADIAETELPIDVLSSLANGNASQGEGYSVELVEDTSLLLGGEDINLNGSGPHFFSNKSEKTATLKIETDSGNLPFNFQVPSKSSFHLGICSDSQSFRSAIRSQSQDSNTRKHFDFILLDPPWPNRSIKRTHKTANSTYDTATSLWDIRNLIQDMDLDMLMSENCLVGIWITNKPAVRDLVLGADGIFECWGLDLVEEWLWLKTTVQGEPVTPLDGLWRKPYEVLLLGRRWRGADQPKRVEHDVESDTPRRVIISVPDLHSRKPCAKSLIEPLMADPHDYRALEVFARHLVAGWWSWGDECIKFNWEGFWQDGTSQKTPEKNDTGQAQLV